HRLTIRSPSRAPLLVPYPTLFRSGACALIATSNYPDSVGSITARAIHVVFDARGYFLGFCEDGTVTDVKTGEYTLDKTGEKEYRDQNSTHLNSSHVTST